MIHYILGGYFVVGVAYTTYVFMTYIMDNKPTPSLLSGIETMVTWPYGLMVAFNQREADAVMPDGKEVYAPEDQEKKPD